MAGANRVLSSNRIAAACCMGFLLTTLPAWSGEAPTQGSQMSHYQALSHAEEGLQATRDKDLKAAAKHAQMALDAAQTAQQDLQKRGVDKDTQNEYAEGIKSLQDAVKQAQAGDADAAKQAAAAAIVKMSGRKPCHGEGCQPSGCGCAVEGMTRCNAFYPTRKCTTWGCNCYCM